MSFASIDASVDASVDASSAVLRHRLLRRGILPAGSGGPRLLARMALAEYAVDVLLDGELGSQ
jgi:hypothetical protein